jgi:hypothetical protein
MKIEKTITTIFFVPTLKVPKDSLKLNGFINGYVKDSTHFNEYKNCIYLLFKPEDLDKFREFIHLEYESEREIVADYDYPGGYVVIVYKLNPIYFKDFKLVKQGKYSKTSKEFQNLFPKVLKLFVNNLHRDELSLQYRIFNKTNDLIEFWEKKLGVKFNSCMEVWEGWEIKKEILNINNYE